MLINSPGISLEPVDPNVAEISLPLDQIISINTSPPSVVGIAPQDSTTPSGTYAVGDSLFFEVVFDKPVKVRMHSIFSFKLNSILIIANH